MSGATQFPMEGLVRGLFNFSIALGFCTGVTCAAEAAILRLDVVGDEAISVEDQSALDLSPLRGVIGFSGPVGSYDVNLVTGLTKPVFPVPLGRPTVQLNSLSVNSGPIDPDGEVLILEFTETDFNLGRPTPPFDIVVPARFEVDGTTTGGLLSGQAFLDRFNRPFFEGVEIGGATLLSSGALAETLSETESRGITVGANQPFSLTTRILVIHDDPGDTTSAQVRATVIPLPATLPMFAAAIGALGWIVRRRRTGFHS